MTNQVVRARVNSCRKPWRRPVQGRRLVVMPKSQHTPLKPHSHLSIIRNSIKPDRVPRKERTLKSIPSWCEPDMSRTRLLTWTRYA